MKGRDWRPRLARDEDVASIEGLIEQSVRRLHPPHYSAAQIEASIGTVFGVDRQLISDGTYYVVEDGGRIIGAGGWSRRASVCGSDAFRGGLDPLIDPSRDSARVRAFFVHPDWVRRGVGRSLLEASEAAIVGAGFSSVLIVSTLAGEALYASLGYEVTQRTEVPLPGGLALGVLRMEKRLLGPVEAP